MIKDYKQRLDSTFDILNEADQDIFGDITVLVQQMAEEITALNNKIDELESNLIKESDDYEYDRWLIGRAQTAINYLKRYK